MWLPLNEHAELVGQTGNKGVVEGTWGPELSTNYSAVLLKERIQEKIGFWLRKEEISSL